MSNIDPAAVKAELQHVWSASVPEHQITSLLSELNGRGDPRWNSVQSAAQELANRIAEAQRLEQSAVPAARAELRAKAREWGLRADIAAHEEAAIRVAKDGSAEYSSPYFGGKPMRGTPAEVAAWALRDGARRAELDRRQAEAKRAADEMRKDDRLAGPLSQMYKTGF